MKLRLSHYHARAKDKFELARWYTENLGFQIIADVAALGEKDGPVFISADGGQTGIAIFSRNDLPEDQLKVACIPAFEVDPQDFIDFYHSQLKKNSEVTIYDHRISFSIYLIDPVGTKLEFVCHQYEKTKELLQANKIECKTMNPSHDKSYTDLR